MNIVIAIGLIITLVTGVPVLMQILKNHPRGLIILFFAEMWERFSYYGMRGILIFFLTQHFLFDDALAGSTYGSYTSLVYLLPLLGGMMADRFIGTRKAVAFGAQHRRGRYLDVGQRHLGGGNQPMVRGGLE